MYLDFISRNTTELKFTIDNLNPGKLYTVAMVTVSAGVSSERTAFNVITSPLSVIGLKAEASNQGLSVTWMPQNDTNQSGFVVCSS